MKAAPSPGRIRGREVRGWWAVLVVLAATWSRAQPAIEVINGGFEHGLSAWQVSGNVRLETNRPLSGNVSAILGPGSGALAQRLETGSGNHLTVSAMIHAAGTNGGWGLSVRFLDEQGRSLMTVDSPDELREARNDPDTFSRYLKPHPLTRVTEIVLSTTADEAPVVVDQVRVEMPDQNAAALQPTCDLDQAMEPFWLGNIVRHEAVLMVSLNGQPATGRLLFRPTRILSVQDYGLATNYTPGLDYTWAGHTLVCSQGSRMSSVRQEDLPAKELQWATIGGKQVMVTYEHRDRWHGPTPVFLGSRPPRTIAKLEAQAPLTIVAYGDSITFGLGESRLSRIPPFLPPWPELALRRLKTIYQDRGIHLYNSAQSGADSLWGSRYAGPMVASLHPDLVLVAFGQNDFWRISAEDFARNIGVILKTVRGSNPEAEFLLISPLRFDPAYTHKPQYWKVVGDYASKLKDLCGPGVQCVDLTALSEAVYSAKAPRDCLNDPLHPNDYFARWYAQAVVAALDTVSVRESAGPTVHERLPLPTASLTR